MSSLSEASESPAVDGSHRALCLLNIHARSGDVDREGLVAMMAEAGIDCRIATAETKDGLAQHLREAAADVDIVIVAGGDGTISGLLPDLLQAGKPVGILPLGTANDLAGSLGIPLRLQEAVAVIADGRLCMTDVTDMTAGGRERVFVNVATVGFGTDIARAHTGPRKKLLGVLAYPLAWLDAYRASRPFRVRLTVDGRVIQTRAVQVAVGSGTRHGGGLVLNEDARHDDGLLWIYYIKPVRWWGWIKLIPALFTGRHRPGGRSASLSGRRVRLETGRALPIDVDGEVEAETPADFAVRPGALPVLAPPQTPREVGR